MFNLEIYREHWMFLAVGTGLVLMLVIVLTYIAIWKAREEERAAPITDFRTFLAWFQRAFPWALILVLAGTWALGLIYPFLKAANPPNW